MWAFYILVNHTVVKYRCKTLNNQAVVTVIKVLLKYLFWTMQIVTKNPLILTSA